MSDDLRGRIAAAIARGYEADHPAPNTHDYRAAGEVIADLGLRVEFGDGREHSYQRVVGKWER